MNDTLTTTAINIMGFDITQIAPLVGSAGLVILILAFYFRDAINKWIAQRSFDRESLVRDVADLKTQFNQHTSDEKEYWKTNDESKKFTEQHMVQTDTQVNNIKMYMESSNREILSEIRNTNEKMTDVTLSIKELTAAFIRHLESK